LGSSFGDLSFLAAPAEKVKETLFVFTDGGARGNPGPAAVGFVIKNARGQTLASQGKTIGIATNNIAEYQAIIEALVWIKKNSIVTERKLIEVFVDSKLAANQLNGLFKIKNKNLREKVVSVRQLERTIGGNVIYHFIPRQKNRLADSLVNQALDKKIR